MAKEIRSSIDIPFPVSDYEVLGEQKYFTLIYPLRHHLAQQLDLSMTVRVLGIEDEEFFEWMEVGGSSPEPIVAAYYDIEYIRDCALRSVQLAEWDSNYDAESLEDYLSQDPQDAAGPMDPDSLVRLVVLKRPTYSLKDLARKYGRRTRKH